jgi:hypothetical protein
MLGSKEAALAANDKALAWFRRSLVDVVNGEPEITKGWCIRYRLSLECWPRELADWHHAGSAL